MELHLLITIFTFISHLDYINMTKNKKKNKSSPSVDMDAVSVSSSGSSVDRRTPFPPALICGEILAKDMDRLALPRLTNFDVHKGLHEYPLESLRVFRAWSHDTNSFRYRITGAPFDLVLEHVAENDIFIMNDQIGRSLGLECLLIRDDYEARARSSSSQTIGAAVSKLTLKSLKEIARQPLSFADATRVADFVEVAPTKKKKQVAADPEDAQRRLLGKESVFVCSQSSPLGDVQTVTYVLTGNWVITDLSAGAEEILLALRCAGYQPSAESVLRSLGSEDLGFAIGDRKFFYIAVPKVEVSSLGHPAGPVLPRYYECTGVYKKGVRTPLTCLHPSIPISIQAISPFSEDLVLAGVWSHIPLFLPGIAAILAAVVSVAKTHNLSLVSLFLQEQVPIASTPVAAQSDMLYAQRITEEREKANLIWLESPESHLTSSYLYLYVPLDRIGRARAALAISNVVRSIWVCGFPLTSSPTMEKSHQYLTLGKYQYMPFSFYESRHFDFSKTDGLAIQEVLSDAAEKMGSMIPRCVRHEDNLLFFHHDPFMVGFRPSTSGELKAWMKPNHNYTDPGLFQCYTRRPVLRWNESQSLLALRFRFPLGYHVRLSWEEIPVVQWDMSDRRLSPVEDCPRSDVILYRSLFSWDDRAGTRAVEQSKRKLSQPPQPGPAKATQKSRGAGSGGSLPGPDFSFTSTPRKPAVSREGSGVPKSLSRMRDQHGNDLPETGSSHTSSARKFQQSREDSGIPPSSSRSDAEEFATSLGGRVGSSIYPPKSTHGVSSSASRGGLCGSSVDGSREPSMQEVPSPFVTSSSFDSGSRSGMARRFPGSSTEHPGGSGSVFGSGSATTRSASSGVSSTSGLPLDTSSYAANLSDFIDGHRDVSTITPDSVSEILARIQQLSDEQVSASESLVTVGAKVESLGSHILEQTHLMLGRLIEERMLEAGANPQLSLSSIVSTIISRQSSLEGVLISQSQQISTLQLSVERLSSLASGKLLPGGGDTPGSTAGLDAEVSVTPVLPVGAALVVGQSTSTIERQTCSETQSTLGTLAVNHGADSTSSALNPALSVVSAEGEPVSTAVSGPSTTVKEKLNPEINHEYIPKAKKGRQPVISDVECFNDEEDIHG